MGQDRLRKHRYRNASAVTKPATFSVVPAGARTASFGVSSLQEGRCRHHPLSPHATWMALEKTEPAPLRRCAAKRPHQQAQLQDGSFFLGAGHSSFTRGLLRQRDEAPEWCRCRSNGMGPPKMHTPYTCFSDRPMYNASERLRSAFKELELERGSV